MKYIQILNYANQGQVETVIQPINYQVSSHRGNPYEAVRQVSFASAPITAGQRQSWKGT